MSWPPLAWPKATHFVNLSAVGKIPHVEDTTGAFFNERRKGANGVIAAANKRNGLESLDAL
jgi:hypothetical protein